MPNSKLENRIFEIPKELINELQIIFNKYKGDKNINGYKRLCGLLQNKNLTYYNIKRIKNYFDNNSYDKNPVEFILNGGKKMETWVNKTLETARESVNNNDSETKKAISSVNPQTRDTSKIKKDKTIVKLNKPVIYSESRKIYIITESQLKRYLLINYL